MSGIITRRRSLLAPAILAGTIAAPYVARSQFFNPPMFMPQPTSSFNPTSLITSFGGLWRADMGVTGNPNVTAWTDQSTQGNNFAVGANNPQFSSTNFNTSFPGIKFTTSGSQQLDFTFTYSSTTLSAFVLGEFTCSGGSGRIFSTLATNDSNAPGWSILDIGSNLATFYCGGAQGNGGSGISVTSSTTPCLIGWVADGAHINAWLNGTLTGSASTFSSTLGQSSAVQYLGADPDSATCPFTAAVVGLTGKAMSSTDWTNLKNWCNSNWGTSF